MNRPPVALPRAPDRHRWPQGGVSSMAGYGVGAVVGAVLVSAATGPGIAPLLVTATSWSLIAMAVARGIQDHPYRDFGAANRVTTLRAAITAVLAGFVPVAASLGPGSLWTVSLLALGALALDGVDGWLARLQGRSSEFGARFDMEVDALLALVMAALLWRSGETGAWVLALGSLRYLFIAASQALPALAAPLYPSWRRKCVCVVQVATLAVCLMPVVTAPLSTALLGAALAALLFSFARDTRWLWQRR